MLVPVCRRRRGTRLYFSRSLTARLTRFINHLQTADFLYRIKFIYIHVRIKKEKQFLCIVPLPFDDYIRALFIYINGVLCTFFQTIKIRSSRNYRSLKKKFYYPPTIISRPVVSYLLLILLLLVATAIRFLSLLVNPRYVRTIITLPHSAKLEVYVSIIIVYVKKMKKRKKK